MTAPKHGPPQKEVGVPRDPDHVEGLPHPTTNTNIVTNAACRCAYGEPQCVCDFYADWGCDWNFPQDTPTQLKRRSAAALRMQPDDSGRRDPISARLGRWAS